MESENDVTKLRAEVARLSAALAKAQQERADSSDDSDRDEATVEADTETVEESSSWHPPDTDTAEPTGTKARKMSGSSRSSSWRDPEIPMVSEPLRPRRLSLGSLQKTSSIALVVQRAAQALRRGSPDPSRGLSGVSELTGVAQPAHRRLIRSPSSIFRGEKSFEKRLEKLRKNESGDSTGSCTKVLRGLARSRSDTTLAFALTPRPSAEDLAATLQRFSSRSKSACWHNKRLSPPRLQHRHAGRRLPSGA